MIRNWTLRKHVYLRAAQTHDLWEPGAGFGAAIIMRESCLNRSSFGIRKQANQTCTIICLQSLISDGLSHTDPGSGVHTLECSSTERLTVMPTIRRTSAVLLLCSTPKAACRDCRAHQRGEQYGRQCPK